MLLPCPPQSYFQDDIFLDARTGEASVTADTWLEGRDAAAEAPVLTTMRPAGMPLLSEKPEEKRTLTKSLGRKGNTLQQRLDMERAAEEKKALGFNRMQDLAVQYSNFNVNQSMGVAQSAGVSRGVDKQRIQDDDSSECEWSD